MFIAISLDEDAVPACFAKAPGPFVDSFIALNHAALSVSHIIQEFTSILDTRAPMLLTMT